MSEPPAAGRPDTQLAAELLHAMGTAIEAGVNLQDAGEALERARREIDRCEAPSLLANRLTALAAGLAEDSALVRIVCTLRDRWQDQLIARRIAAINARLAADAEAGLAEASIADWQDALAEAVGEFRFDIAQHLAGALLPMPAQLRPSQAVLAACCRAAIDDRWREARALFVQLGGAGTRTPLFRARALTIQAEIDAVVLQDFTEAAIAAAKAEELAPGDWRLSFVRARIADQQKRPEEAEAHFHRAAEAELEGGTAHAAWALFRARQGDAERAEAHLQSALRPGINPLSGLLAEIELAGLPPLFETRRHRIATLVARVRLLAPSPAIVYDALIEAARAFEANAQPEAALAWYEEARALDPERMKAHLNRGYLKLAQRDFADARSAFRHVAETARGAVDGYWGLVNLAEETRDWPGLLDAARECLARAPDWREMIAGRLRSIANDLLASDPRPAEDEARRFYDGARAILGERFEPSYRNLLGNLAYRGEQYAAAATQYRAAIAAAGASPDARFHGNLALALEEVNIAFPDRTELLDEAIAEVERAQALRPDDADYPPQRRRLRLTRAFVERHGAAARLLKQDEVRLRIRLEPSLVGLLVEQDEAGTDQLRKVFSDHIGLLRAAIRADCHFTLCGVRLQDAPEHAGTKGWWALQLGAREAETNEADPAITAEALMAAITDAIRRNLPGLVGHGEAAEIARQCAGAAVPAGERLTRLMQNARALLAGKGRIVLPEDRAALLEGAGPEAPPHRAGPPPPDPPPEIERIELATGSDAADPTTDWAGVQASVHAATGVVVPLAVHRIDPAVPAESVRLRLSTRPGSDIDISELWSDEIAERLQGVAARLLGLVCVRWQLEALRAASPELVAAAEATLPEAVLLERLRTTVAGGASILNLHHVLEALVVSEAGRAIDAAAALQTA